MIIRRNILSIILVIAILLSSVIPVFADGERTEDERIREILDINSKEGNSEILIFGDKLNQSQMDSLKKYYNVYGKDIKTIYISNQEERDALLKYVPEKVVGTRAISSAYIRLHEDTEEEGIQVRTNNITWVTEDMYRNALATAGVENATILVSAPFPVSGTAALTGTVKAYEELTGNSLSEESKDVANEEIIKTVELSDEIGDEEAEKIMSEIKYNVIDQDLKDPEKITIVVEEVAEKNNITLTDKQVEEITKLMERISNLDLNVNDIKTQLSDIIGKLDNIEINTDEAKGLLSKIFQAIKDFFSKLIGNNGDFNKDNNIINKDNQGEKDEIKKKDGENNDISKDVSENEDKIDKESENKVSEKPVEENKEDLDVEEIVEPDNSIFIKMETLNSINFSEENFPAGVFRYGESNEVLVFRPNVDLENFNIVELEFDGDDLVERDVVLNKISIKANNAFGINSVIPEGIPLLRIKWENQGKSFHYDIAYNGKNGMSGDYIIMK